RRHVAEGQGHRGSPARRCTPCARRVVPLARGNTRRSVHQRGHGYPYRPRHQRPQPRRAAERAMTRLWDKGAPLDARVLDYTAGEDHALDERLVPYDVRASIAHAEMLNAQQLLSAGDLAALPEALRALAAQHPPGPR